MTDSVQFGSRKITYAIQFSDRRTLGITVTPENNIVVKSPISASREIIKDKVLKKAGWILKQQNFFLSFQPKNKTKRFVGGETHLYLGRQYGLKIIAGAANEVKLRGRFIEVETDDRPRTKQLMKDWYLKNAREKFNSIAAPLIEKFKKHGVSPSSIILREMPTRWGSCTAKGKIILNPELVKAPKGCIEYVIIHELCHLVHYNHTQKFISLQTKEMPDWEKWKSKLENLLA